MYAVTVKNRFVRMFLDLLVWAWKADPQTFTNCKMVWATIFLPFALANRPDGRVRRSLTVALFAFVMMVTLIWPIWGGASLSWNRVLAALALLLALVVTDSVVHRKEGTYKGMWSVPPRREPSEEELERFERFWSQDFRKRDLRSKVLWILLTPIRKVVTALVNGFFYAGEGVESAKEKTCFRIQWR